MLIPLVIGLIVGQMVVLILEWRVFVQRDRLYKKVLELEQMVVESAPNKQPTRRRWYPPVG